MEKLSWLWGFLHGFLGKTISRPPFSSMHQIPLLHVSRCGRGSRIALLSQLPVALILFYSKDPLGPSSPYLSFQEGTHILVCSQHVSTDNQPMSR